LDGGIFDDEINLDYYKDEMLRYYTNIIGRFSGQVEKALQKAATLPIRIICPVHGPVWRTKPSVVFDWYSGGLPVREIRALFWLMPGCTAILKNGGSHCPAAGRERHPDHPGIQRFEYASVIYFKKIWKYNGIVLGLVPTIPACIPIYTIFATKLIMQPGNKKFPVRRVFLERRARLIKFTSFCTKHVRKV
jgi:hypothetical protein